MIGIAGDTVKDLRKIGRLDREMHSKNWTFFMSNLVSNRFYDPNLERDNYFNDAKELFQISKT